MYALWSIGYYFILQIFFINFCVYFILKIELLRALLPTYLLHVTHLLYFNKILIGQLIQCKKHHFIIYIDNFVRTSKQQMKNVFMKNKHKREFKNLFIIILKFSNIFIHAHRKETLIHILISSEPSGATKLHISITVSIIILECKVIKLILILGFLKKIVNANVNFIIIRNYNY